MFRAQVVHQLALEKVEVATAEALEVPSVSYENVALFQFFAWFCSSVLVVFPVLPD